MTFSLYPILQASAGARELFGDYQVTFPVMNREKRNH
ncbi:uncharacterized protein RSE6_10011 [Rhynchosporium secalis]|uniref:Uncharacterized protein n=1 Tax=Rhynchosporium secalis TaxID=38038 RepID=A0A1E1MKC7_RHYSE|nr:uncharacterized protein RSE6_10011 [Rhynchosporium secalis]